MTDKSSLESKIWRILYAIVYAASLVFIMIKISDDYYSLEDFIPFPAAIAFHALTLNENKSALDIVGTMFLIGGSCLGVWSLAQQERGTSIPLGFSAFLIFVGLVLRKLISGDAFAKIVSKSLDTFKGGKKE
ncbi:hypothetical protein [Agarilytica rhodophyticola]|uniref:hypothetical protein n=1 Tax=Agarilytica rhodophyticola TaxID=1737490 RepID=UPI000B348156|nr:hypothetical protein [Agarilytica rhodophyticola]